MYSEVLTPEGMTITNTEASFRGLGGVGLQCFWNSSNILSFVFQVDTMEVMRHPEETTNMKRQTMASYFRVQKLNCKQTFW